MGLGSRRRSRAPPAPALSEIDRSPLLLVLALGGLCTRPARQAPKWLWLIPACLLTTVFVTGFIRFRSPIDPFLVMLAALFVADLLESLTLRGKLAASMDSPPGS